MERVPQLKEVDLPIQDSGFFVIRTPGLPMDELVMWADSLKAHQMQESGADEKVITEAWASDVALLRSRLKEIADRAEVQHALFVASPSLESSFRYWKKDPDGKQGKQAERSLVRYFSRMCARPTPFGLFAGYSTGRIAQDDAETTNLLLESRDSYRLCCRLDFDYLFALTATLQSNPAIASELSYWPNSSLRRIGDVWHYVESRTKGSNRSHHLVKLQRELILDALIERASAGLSIESLVEFALGLSGCEEYTSEEIREYIFELVSNGVLVSTLVPLVTGPPALDDLIDQLNAIPAGIDTARCLSRVREAMTKIDHMGPDVGPPQYRAIASSLDQLHVDYDLSKLFQVDLLKPAPQLVLSKQLLTEVKNAIALLYHVGQSSGHNDLRVFRDAFVNRYEHAWVPLELALDEETGIGFGASSGAESSPLLRDLPGLKQNAQSASPDEFHLLLKKAFESAPSSTEPREIVIEMPDIPPTKADRVFPTAFDASMILVAPSEDALRAGDFSIHLKGISGPPGTRLIGRFCLSDSTLQDYASDHIVHEERCEPDAIFAEIVHLPEGRIGNVLCRPVLRDYEIVYLGRSGAPIERQIPISDLLVTVEPNGRIILYSLRLGKRVIPRLSNAHGYFNPKLATVYRFLSMLQHEEAEVSFFSWGDLGGQSTLPRVRVGRVILACAQWRLSAEEVKALVKGEGCARFVALQDLRKQRGLPRWVEFIESDNSLPVDLDNPLSVDAFLHVLKRAGQGVLQEMYPSPDELCVTGPEGRFSHEILIPFVRSARIKDSDATGKSDSIRTAIEGIRNDVPRLGRTVAPGGEWLYAKLYAGPATLDEIAATLLPKLIADGRERGLFSSWFFIRYGDPNLHLRVRFRGDSNRMAEELMPLIFKTVAPLIYSGRAYKLQFDTYEREIERYGGPEGLAVSEAIFHADSDAVLELMQLFEGDEGNDLRWRVALLAMECLYDDFRINLHERQKIAQRMRDSYEKEFGIGVAGRKNLSDKFRKERRHLETMFENKETDRSFRFVREVLAKRSEQLRNSADNLRGLAAAGKLKVDVNDLVSLYNHLHVNRMLRMEQRAHEMVFYDFLHRLYEARLARLSRVTETDFAALHS